MTKTMEKPEVAPATAAERLQAAEADAAPLRARIVEIDALLPGLRSPRPTIEEEIAARRQANDLVLLTV